jgi:hypothetical protein
VDGEHEQEAHAQTGRSDELPRLAQAVIKADCFPSLATIDGDQPRVRPGSPVRTDDFTVYVANLRSQPGRGAPDRSKRGG